MEESNRKWKLEDLGWLVGNEGMEKILILTAIVQEILLDYQRDRSLFTLLTPPLPPTHSTTMFMQVVVISAATTGILRA